jgi:hypothetical protein
LTLSSFLIMIYITTIGINFFLKKLCPI